MSTRVSAPERLVYRFADGGRDDRDLLGGKGANLGEMTRLGLPVPPGFIVTTAACRAFMAAGDTLGPELVAQLDEAVTQLEADTGRTLGGRTDPLLVAVRSGAPVSMPGMMDTVLDLGMSNEAVVGFAEATGDVRSAWDSYRRFVQLFGEVVLGVEAAAFEARLDEVVAARGLDDETGLSAEDLRGLTRDFLALVEERTGQPFPQEPRAQLRAAVSAVFASWNGRRARDYRAMAGIPDDVGTAVNVQAMVFGNRSTDSGTGVAFTRDPATGQRTPYGDWLEGAQGEDVVAGIRRTTHLDELERRFPTCHGELMEVLERLERHYRDMCDVEFTIEQGHLWILQTRVGQRSAQAAVTMAVEMAGEGLIDRLEALRRVTPQQVERLLHPHVAPGAESTVLATGLAASPGAARGEIRLTADAAEEAAGQGVDVILVRAETSPDDLHGLIAARGVLTSRGGLVSHAAVVARGMGRPAVCGAASVHIDVETGTVQAGDRTLHEGDVVTIDGTTGAVMLGAVDLVTPEPSGDIETLLAWADDVRTLGVKANADTPTDVERALSFGAEGIGLCRTEHMFLGDRLPVVQEMILASTDEQRGAALEHLGAVQRDDFIALLRAAAGRTITVRLLDPPLHEFLPDVLELVEGHGAGTLDAAHETLLEAALEWREANPMLGVRGCRLGILLPGLYRTQTTALCDAAVAVHAAGTPVDVEIMIPLVSLEAELGVLAGWIRESADAALAGSDVEVRIGTMIETPRAALVAGRLARHAEFFSFGTNDLTQMTYGWSRDDVEGPLMSAYREHGVLSSDPFAHLDEDGVGALMAMALREGRASRPGLVTGVCGEHGGDPESIALCHAVGVDDVSCSPFRVPVARLAAAHAALAAQPTADEGVAG